MRKGRRASGIGRGSLGLAGRSERSGCRSNTSERVGKNTMGMVGGLALGFVGLRDGEKSRGMDGRDGCTRVKSDGNVVRGDRIREFGKGEDVVGTFREESADKRATQRFDGSPNRGERIGGIFHEGMPSGAGKTDLVVETAHEQYFLGEGRMVSVRGKYAEVKSKARLRRRQRRQPCGTMPCGWPRAGPRCGGWARAPKRFLESSRLKIHRANFAAAHRLLRQAKHSPRLPSKNLATQQDAGWRALDTRKSTEKAGKAIKRV